MNSHSTIAEKNTCSLLLAKNFFTSIDREKYFFTLVDRRRNLSHNRGNSLMQKDEASSLLH